MRLRRLPHTPVPPRDGLRAANIRLRRQGRAPAPGPGRFGALAYINLSARGQLVFSWLLALGGLSTLFTWGTICLAHIRFRAAWRVQGHSLEELPFRAVCGVWGSWAALVLVFLVLVAQLYVALDPVPGASRDPRQVASAFFQAYIPLPVDFLFYIVGYAWKRTTPGVRTKSTWT
jgi:amino acid transporter